MATMGTTGTEGALPVSPRKARHLRIALVAILLVLTVQGWTGDTVNIFVAPANGTTAPTQDLSGFFTGVKSLGGLLVWHAVEGMAIIALGVVVLVLSFLWSRERSVRICAVLGLFFVIAGGYGGYSFVLSGFSAGPSSATMGGSFIGAFAFYFMTLYFAK